jgi:hypothetical protein
VLKNIWAFFLQLHAHKDAKCRHKRPKLSERANGADEPTSIPSSLDFPHLGTDMDTEEEEVLSGNEVHSDEDLSESESEAIQEETDEVEGNNEQVEEPAVVYDVVTREHRKHQRMILQVVISAIIVVASGAALLVFRILRGIGYVVSHPTPSSKSHRPSRSSV